MCALRGRLAFRLLCLLLPAFGAASWSGGTAVAGSGGFEAFSFRQEPSFGFCPPLDSVFSATIRAADDGGYELSMRVLREGEPGVDPCLDDVLGTDCATLVEVEPRLLSTSEERLVVPAIVAILRSPSPEPHPDCGVIDACVVNVFTVDGETLRDGPCDAPRLTYEQSRTLVAVLNELQEGTLRLENGDTNGDFLLNVSDAVYLLRFLFTGGPPPVEIDCPDLSCPSEERVELENGDVNGDDRRNVSDAVYILRHLFTGGPAVVPACACREPAPCAECPAPSCCVPRSFEASVCTADLATCEEVEAVYEFLVNDYGTHCGFDTACHLVTGHCTEGLGSGCYYPLTTKVAFADLQALAIRFEELGCFDPDEPICECPPPPDRVSCENGRCDFSF